jgi:hypothetical protein
MLQQDKADDGNNGDDMDDLENNFHDVLGSGATLRSVADGKK